MNKGRILSLPLIALVNFVLPIWLGSAIFGLFIVSGLDGSRSPAQIMQGGVLAVALFPVFATLILGIPTLLYASLIVALCSGAYRYRKVILLLVGCASGWFLYPLYLSSIDSPFAETSWIGGVSVPVFIFAALISERIAQLFDRRRSQGRVIVEQE